MDNKIWKNIIDGFVCHLCETNETTYLKLNKDKQLEYHCWECRRKWI